MRRLVNVALLIMSLGLSLGLGEILLRQIYAIDTGRSFEFRIPHPLLGWVLEPGVSYVNQMPEAKVPVTYNAHGWRDTEHEIENRHRRFRILVLGDSFMEAYSVRLEDAFHKQLEQLAHDQGMNLEVINFGVGGYGTLQEYLAFREMGTQYRPDLVLLGFYVGNDVADNSLALQSIIRRKGSMKVTSRPFLDPSSLPSWELQQVDYEAAVREYSAQKAKRDSFSERLQRQSALWQAWKQAKKRIENMFLGKDDHLSGTGDPGTEADRHMALHGVHYCDEPDEYTRAWTVTENILERLRKEVSDTGGTLFVFTVPSLQEVDVQVMDAVRRDAPKQDMICPEDAPGYLRLAGVLRRRHIGYVNLLPSFRSVMREDGINLFRRSDRHWNEEAHRLAARGVFSALTGKDLLPLDKTRRADLQGQPFP